MKFKIIIPIKPAAKERPRFGQGRTYTPIKTLQFEESLKLVVASKLKQQFTGCLKMDIKFFYGTKNKKKYGHKPTRPDIDNLIKTVLDGLNGVAYADDNQVVSITAEKFYSESDKVEISIEEIGPC